MQLASVTGNPVPHGLKCGEVITSDGISLRYAVSADAPARRGTICILPGRTEYIEKYYETIINLQARGFTVAILDWRGQGGSERLLGNRKRGHVKRFSDYEADLAAFMTGVVLPDCPPPFFGLGHSMGATVLLQALTRHTWFTGCVLSAPMIGLDARIVPTGLVRALANLLFITGLSFLPVPFVVATKSFRSNILTHDQNRFERERRMIASNPHLETGAPSWRWLRAALKACDRLGKMEGRDCLHAPVLMIMAGEDKVVVNEATRRFSRRVEGAPSVSVKNAYHELLMEADPLREQFWAAFDTFIQSHL